MCEEKELCAPASALRWASSVNNLHTKTRECSNLLWTCRGQCRTSFLFSVISVSLLVPIFPADVGRSFSFLQDTATYYWMRWQALWMGPEPGRETGETKGGSRGSGGKWGIRVCNALCVLKTVVLCLIPEEFSKDRNSPDSFWVTP